VKDAMSDRDFYPHGQCWLSVSQALVALIIFSGLSAPTLAEPQARADFSHGAITDKVICQADPTQSYALYLPSAYTPQRNWPILYSFDPGGRGEHPVELFKEAAEKYGWIVVGSYNSRNGPGVPLNDIVMALWRDTHERFAIDERRVYTAGMSGGARVASSVAIGMRGRVAGVVACGAGFPYAETPMREMHFAYFALAGIEDFNLIELHQLEEGLTKANIANQLLTFEGDHVWPSKLLLEEAVAWHEVMAFQMKRRPPDAATLNALYEQGLERARALEAAARPYEAFMRYRMLARSFQGLRSTDEADARLRELQNAKVVQEQINQLKAADRQQESRWRELTNVTQGVKSADTQMQALVDGKNLAARLRKQAEVIVPSTDRIVARRLLGLFSVTVSEEASGEMYRKNFGVAAALLTLAVELRPNNPQALYRLAAAQAQSGQKRLAMEALTRAVAQGFNDVSRLEQSEEFASLRQEKAFKELIEKLKSK
jgi:pimeloyl-ACP methyl ester carboxylesterase